MMWGIIPSAFIRSQSLSDYGAVSWPGRLCPKLVIIDRKQHTPVRGYQKEKLLLITNAEGGNRTHTPLEERDFESRASTNSATSALP